MSILVLLYHAHAARQGWLPGHGQSWAVPAQLWAHTPPDAAAGHWCQARGVPVLVLWDRDTLRAVPAAVTGMLLEPGGPSCCPLGSCQSARALSWVRVSLHPCWGL